MIRGGLFYKNNWLNLTSMVTYISKSNNIDQQNLTKPGTKEGKTVLLIYNIQTLGWTTSAEIDPFKGFHLHALFTYQKPVYKNYNASVTFDDGAQMSVNANGMIVKEIPQVLVELDPRYQLERKQASVTGGNGDQLPEPERSQRHHQRFGTDHQRRSGQLCRTLYERKLPAPVYRRI